MPDVPLKRFAIEASSLCQIINVNIPKGFADDNLEKFRVEVEKAKLIARETPEEGIISALEGMKQRHDTTAVMKESTIPLLWILGEKDNYINFQATKDRIPLNERGRILLLKNSGHMGFIEEKEPCAKHLISLIRQE